MPKLKFDWQSACAHVARGDTKLAAVMAARAGQAFNLRRLKTPFHGLARAIVYQQLSGKAAGTIHGRVLDLFEGRDLDPQALLRMKPEKLRGAGLSANKLRALQDLARKTLEGLVPGFAALNKLEDEQIIERLTQVHGVGRWTVEMLLIFQLGRPDVLPVADLGVRKGLMIAHGMKSLPAESTLRQRARAWAPFRTVGSWYCWRACEQ